MDEVTAVQDWIPLIKELRDNTDLAFDAVVLSTWPGNAFWNGEDSLGRLARYTATATSPRNSCSI